MDSSLPPPPTSVLSGVVPAKLEMQSGKSKNNLLPMTRRGYGSKGQKTPLLTNHFRVNVTKPDSQFFYQYDVTIRYEDGPRVEAKGLGRKILDKVQETYRTDLRYFAYDGDRTLFTVGALPTTKLEFSVVLADMLSNRNNSGNASPNETNDADRKRSKRPHQSKIYIVELNYAAQIPIQAIASALHQGIETDQLPNAIRVLDVILRQNAARQGCLTVRQSFFRNEPESFKTIGEGVDCCRGFHSSFRNTQDGLSLNIDVSTTMIIHPGPVLDFLVANQKVKDEFSIKWNEAKRTLKNLRVRDISSNREFKITGLSERLCKDQTFTRRQKNANGEVEEDEITVFAYFTDVREINLRSSGKFPCVNVGKANHPNYIPIELCHLVSLQRYTKVLSPIQRTNLVNVARQKPREKMDMLTNALKTSDYNSEPVLQESGISIGSSNFTQVAGRILQPPKLKVGNGEDIFPRNGRWNFINKKKLVQPATVTDWAVVNFSDRRDTHQIISDLIKRGEEIGMNIDPPLCPVFEEHHQFKNAPGSVRVEKMFKHMESKLKNPPKFLICILSERKNSKVYGPWKKKTLVEHGIVTQCIAPPRDVKDQYLSNVLLKINAKLGGLNSLLDMERSLTMPSVTKVPTIIVGMDVSHGSSGHSDIPSVAAVVSSREWPLISKYRACVRTQPPKVEMIDNLFKPVSENDDEGIFRELLLDFYSSSGKRKPDHIIIFRDGVSESQFNQVLNIELDQIMQACRFLDAAWDPNFTVIIAQKNHHTKFFQSGRDSFNNVLPGTIVDRNICHPRNNDFYLCAHAGMIGTTKPTHYHVLYDEIGFSTDDLQELVHSLSYVYQRSTTAISVVAPICYAHLAAAQMRTAMKFEDMYETSSSHGGITTVGEVPVPPMPRLNKNVANSMFFC